MRTADRRADAARCAALLVAAALALGLSGCASRQKRPPPPEVEVVQPPPRPPPPPKPPTHAPTPPPVAPPPAHDFGAEKARRKLELAGDERNAVGAAEVGYYLDVLIGRLKQRLGPEAGIARRGEHVVIVMPASAGFGVGEATLPPALRGKLSALSQVLVEYRRVLVSVYVLADASVIGASNPRLAQQRAGVIAAYLGGAGIDPRRVLVAPLGPARPASPGAGARSRIEIELEPVLRPSPRARARS